MSLLAWQQDVWYDHSRFRTVVAGRRSGKSILALNEGLRAAQSGMKKNVVYVAPSIRQAKSIMWQYLKEAIPPDNIFSKNENDLEIVLKGTMSHISLRGAENIDSLRGLAIDFLICDEIQDIPLDAIEVVLLPACMDRQADGLFIGTPKGKGDNTAYIFYMRGLTEDGWKSWQINAYEAGTIPKEELDKAKKFMSEKDFNQELMASFETLEGRIYYAFNARENVDKEVVDNGGMIYVGMDFNVNPMTAVIANPLKNGLNVFDEIVIRDSNTRELCTEIRKRYPEREIVVFPDPSGKSRRSSASSGVTDHTIIRDEFKWSVVAPSKAPKVADRINDVNTLLRDADGNRKLKINPNCKQLIKCLDNHTYKEGTTLPDKTLGYDHMNDALGYIITSEYSMIKREAKIINLEWAH